MDIPMLGRPHSREAVSEDRYLHSPKFNRFSMNYWVVCIPFLSLFIRRLRGYHQGRQMFFFFFLLLYKTLCIFHLVLSGNTERDHFSPHTSFPAFTFKCSDSWSELTAECWVQSSLLIAIQTMWQTLGTPTCFREKTTHFSSDSEHDICIQRPVLSSGFYSKWRDVTKWAFLALV